MTVTIIGTLEQIFTSGGETVSEAVHVNFESPTDAPLPLHEVIVFTERNPPVDIRIPLEAHLEEDHGFTSVTRVPVSREGAMAEWTAVRSDSIPANIVLWFLVPLQQVGVEWGLVAVGNTSVVGSGYRSVEVGEDASSAAEGSIAIGPESTVPETSPRSVAIGEGAVIPPDTPDRTVLRSKEIWVRPHADADRVDSAVILQDASGSSRTIRATTANSITVNGVPVGGGSNTAIWGGITGTLANQADLATALSVKVNTDDIGALAAKDKAAIADIDATGPPNGTTYLRGDGSWVIPPNTIYPEIAESEITNGTGLPQRTITGRRAQFIVNKARDGVALASSLALVATSGSYNDLANRPTLGSLAAKSAVSVPADISATGTPGTTTYLRGDGAWTTPPNTNTTYTEITAAEITTGTASTARTISGRRAQDIVNKAREGLALAASIPTQLAQLDTTVTGTQLNALKTKVDGVATGATANATDAALRARSSHTGTQLAATISDFSTTVASHSAVAANTSARHTHSNKAVLDAVTAAYTTAMNTKLSGIATGATSNQTDAYLVNRGNHTGNQAIHTITNLQEILDGKPLVVDVGNRSTAIGVDAQAVGASSFAAGDTATAFGINSIAIGVDSDATGLDSTALGQDANATNDRATAVGRDANSSGLNSSAYGWGALASGQDSIALGVSSKADAQYSTAVGTNAQATGESSFAAGHGAEATGENSVAVGLEAAANRDNTTAIGNYATASDEGATAVGGGASASGANATAVGFLSEATGHGASATGVRAKAHGQASNAVGVDAHVPATSPRSQAFGYGVVIPENTPDTTVISAASLEVNPDPWAIGNISTITLYDAAGDPHVIPATVGQTHSYTANGSPAAENVTGVGTYASGKVIYSSTLQALIPAITTGVWNVDVVASALVYRSVATGGVWLYLGNGSTAITQALGRLSPQTHAYTLNLYGAEDQPLLAALSPTSTLDLRYTGFSTAGTTHVVNHGWKITARRVG